MFIVYTAREIFSLRHLQSTLENKEKNLAREPWRQFKIRRQKWSSTDILKNLEFLLPRGGDKNAPIEFRKFYLYRKAKKKK